MKRVNLYKLLRWLIPVVLACAAFVFFQWWYPYHLFRREQAMIFLLDHEFVSNYMGHAGWLADLAGDFLTQFFYYVGAGAAIIAVLLGLLWTVCYAAAKQVSKYTVINLIFATAVTVWEWLRECGELYSVGSTLSLIGAFVLLYLVLKIKNQVAKTLVAIAAIALCYWCLGYSAFILAILMMLCTATQRQWVTCAAGVLAIAIMPKASLKQAQWWGQPNFYREHKLAIDSEAYFGDWDKVLELTLQGNNTKYESFYYYLINAIKGNLPDALLKRMPKDADGLLPSMDPSRNSLDLSALGEAWYYMGDMTSAEHCTIVAMISSNRYTGSRYLKRLAEINLANGDNEAAMKYLRMLSKTICHQKWAKNHMPERETESVKARREDMSKYIVDADTLRFVNDYTRTLRHLNEGNAHNDLAYDYLLCHHLLRCDIKSFAEDFDPTRQMPRLYQEALLIHLSVIGASEDEVESYNIPTSTLEDFYNFNQMLPMTDANKGKIAARFGNTYWYFYQLAQQ